MKKRNMEAYGKSRGPGIAVRRFELRRHDGVVGEINVRISAAYPVAGGMWCCEVCVKGDGAGQVTALREPSAFDAVRVAVWVFERQVDLLQGKHGRNLTWNGGHMLRFSDATLARYARPDLALPDGSAAP